MFFKVKTANPQTKLHFQSVKLRLYYKLLTVSRILQTVSDVNCQNCFKQ